MESGKPSRSFTLKRLLKLTLRSRTTVFIHDLLMVPLAWIVAFWLRFNLELESTKFLYQAWLTLPTVILIQLIVFWKVGLYRGMWRFSSIMDVERIIKAAVVGMFLIAVAFLFINRLEGIPRSIFPLYNMTLIALLAIPRFCYRLWKERAIHSGQQLRALIVGAGSAGEMLARDLLANSVTKRANRSVKSAVYRLPALSIRCPV